MLLDVVKFIHKWKLHYFNVSNVKHKFLSILLMLKSINLKLVSIVNLKILSKSYILIVILLTNNMSKYNNFLNMCHKDKHQHLWIFYVMIIMLMVWDQVIVSKLLVYLEHNLEKSLNQEVILIQYFLHSLIWSLSKFYKKIDLEHHYQIIKHYLHKKKNKNFIKYQAHNM